MITDLNTYITNRIGYYAPGRQDGGTVTLHAIQRRDYASLDPHAVLIIVGQAITFLLSRRETLESEACRLQQLGPIDAQPHYRKDQHGQPRYLYLNHPTHNDEPRKRKYIGADPAKQRQALDRLQAYKDLVKVQTEIREIDNRLAAITGHLARSLLAATKGIDRIW